MMFFYNKGRSGKLLNCIENIYSPTLLMASCHLSLIANVFLSKHAPDQPVGHKSRKLLRTFPRQVRFSKNIFYFSLYFRIPIFGEM